jgi:hypothetical protein
MINLIEKQKTYHKELALREFVYPKDIFDTSLNPNYQFSEFWEFLW